jgi:succinoglycan biosynthesis protein ExoA
MNVTPEIVTTSQDQQYPLVTVIMPVRNEFNSIEKSLGSVLSQDYPSDRMEIFVVDGMSEDGTRSRISSPRVRILDNPERFVSSALNRGLREASGEIIVRVDGHCLLQPDYIRRCVQALRESGGDCAGGMQKALGKGVLGEAIAIGMSSSFGVGNAYFHYGEQSRWVDTVYLGAYWRKVFARIGGFDEDLIRNQDDELNFRLLQSGGKIWFDPSLQTQYFVRPSLPQLWRQYYQYGLYKVLVFRKRDGFGSIRQLVPSAFLLAICASILCALIFKQPLWLLPVLGPYAAVCIATSLWSAKKNWKTVFFLPAVFFVLHAAYGAGFIAGIWKWRAWSPNEASQPKDFTTLKP